MRVSEVDSSLNWTPVRCRLGIASSGGSQYKRNRISSAGSSRCSCLSNTTATTSTVRTSSTSTKTTSSAGQSTTANVTYDSQSFFVNGQKFQIIGGQMDPQRVPRAYWPDRLQMARAKGLNTIFSYVYWHLLERTQGN